MLPEESFLLERLRKYVLYRFLLNEDECQTDDINEIAKISLAKSLHMDKALMKNIDRESTCDRASPVMTKRLLLFIAIQSELNIQLPPDETPGIKTIADLASLVWRVMYFRA